MRRQTPLVMERTLTVRSPVVRSPSRGRSPIKSQRKPAKRQTVSHPRRRKPHAIPDTRWQAPKAGFGLQNLGNLDPKLLEKIMSVLSGRAEEPEVASSNEDEAEGDGMPSGRTATLNRRCGQRVRRLVDDILEGNVAVDLSLLEQRSLSRKALKRYRSRFQNFLAWCAPRKPSDPRMMDELLTEFLNQKYLEGYQSYVGADLLASLCVFQPEFRPLEKTVPRALRSMKGWRKLCPGLSKRPWPWAVWCGIAVEVAQTSPVMGLCILLGVDLYLRIVELMSAQCGDLLRPTTEGVNHWGLMLFPRSRRQSSKTGTYDEVIPVDSQRTQWMVPALRP